MFGFMGGLRRPSQAAQRAEVTSGHAACWKDPHRVGSPSESMAELVPGTEASRTSGGRLAVPAEGTWCWRCSLRHPGFTRTPWSSEQARHLHKLGGEVAVWGCSRHGRPGAAGRAGPSPKHKAYEKPGGMASVSGV